MAEIILSFLILHAILWIGASILHTVTSKKFRLSVVLIMLMVPVFGPLSMILFTIYKWRNLEQYEVEVPRFELESEIYSSMGIQPSSESVIPLEEAFFMNVPETRRNLMMDLIRENVVPLEDALTVSSSVVRRKLMMDVLNSDVVPFYELLEQARLNDDVEVVHYATTAMSELNKKYDVLLEKISTEWEHNQDDLEITEDYCCVLEEYLSLGLSNGSMQELRRSQCIELLRKLYKQEPKRSNCCGLIKQLLIIKEFEEAEQLLQAAETRWPDDEDIMLLRLEFHARRGEGEIVRALASSIVNSGRYLSANAKEKLSFWMNEGAVL